MSIPKQKTQKELQAEISDFNSKHPVGSIVKLKLDGDKGIVDVTVKHEATIMGGHTAVGWFEGVSGCYNLNHVIS